MVMQMYVSVLPQALTVFNWNSGVYGFLADESYTFHS